MIKTNNPLTDLAAVMTDSGITELEKMAYVKRATAYIENYTKTALAKANADFIALCRKFPGVKAHVLCDGMATATAYGGQPQWAYPDAIVKAAAALKAMQEQAQASGTAKNVAEQDPKRHQLFKISVLEKD